MSRELAATLNPSDAPDLGRGERRLYAADATARLAGTIRQANTLIARGAIGSLNSDNLEAAVLTELADALTVGPVETPKESAADKVVSRCIEAASTLGPMPNVAELAEAVGATSRWVRAAFNQRFGMPPSAWFRERFTEFAVNSRRRTLRRHRLPISQ